jgi:hypothetical protein
MRGAVEFTFLYRKLYLRNAGILPAVLNKERRTGVSPVSLIQVKSKMRIRVKTLHYQLTSVRIWNALYLKRVFEIEGNLKIRFKI